MTKLQVVPTAIREHKRPKVTCTTCQLKKCIGRCHWEPARPRTAA